jgi:hypothetical protein
MDERHRAAGLRPSRARRRAARNCSGAASSPHEPSQCRLDHRPRNSVVARRDRRLASNHHASTRQNGSRNTAGRAGRSCFSSQMSISSRPTRDPQRADGGSLLGDGVFAAVLLAARQKRQRVSASTWLSSMGDPAGHAALCSLPIHGCDTGSRATKGRCRIILVGSQSASWTELSRTAVRVVRGATGGVAGRETRTLGAVINVSGRRCHGPEVAGVPRLTGFSPTAGGALCEPPAVGSAVGVDRICTARGTAAERRPTFLLAAAFRRLRLGQEQLGLSDGISFGSYFAHSA